MKSRKRRKLAQQQARRRRSVIVVIVLAIGLSLVASGIYAYLSGPRTTAAALDYDPEDIVYDQPILAIHEMGEGPPIPFLPRNEPQPSISISADSYDFGNIGPNDVVERTFVVFNTGGAPLTISRAYTTCGCTTAEISTRSIPPGKVAEVTVIFDAGYHDTSGQTVRRGLIIENNDPRQSQAEIWIQASVRNS